MAPAMTPELWMLVYSGLLLFVLIITTAVANGVAGNGPWAGSNRDTPAPKPMPVWGGRANRAYVNMQETLPIFIIAVIAAHLAGVSTSHTLLGAQLYFWGRLAHAVIYIAGIPYIRTVAWLVSIVGIALILFSLCGTL
jgi:uncharacterized MAPEG superfamily protein